jgi:hypothetical protein
MLSLSKRTPGRSRGAKTLPQISRFEIPLLMMISTVRLSGLSVSIAKPALLQFSFVWQVVLVSSPA